MKLTKKSNYENMPEQNYFLGFFYLIDQVAIFQLCSQTNDKMGHNVLIITKISRHLDINLGFTQNMSIDQELMVMKY